MVEHILGANPAVYMYAMGAGLANIFYNNGTDEQKKWAVICSERNWGATMVLTEPDAGSDVGAGRTKATQQPDGSWHIDGVKRFITSADSMTCSRTSSTWCSPAPTAPGPAPRACRCSSSRSSTSTMRPAS